MRASRGAPNSCAGGPCSTMRPPSRNSTRCATSRANAISCVAIRIVAPSRAELAHQLEHLADELGVEGAGDLVEQQHLGVGRDRPHDRGALLLPARQLVGVHARLVGEADAVEQLEPALLGVARATSRAPRAAPSVTLSSTDRCGNRL